MPKVGGELAYGFWDHKITEGTAEGSKAQAEA